MSNNKGGSERYKENEKAKDVRMSNIDNAKAVADLVRTSLGPRGMDKMISDPRGEVIISNDGATILKTLEVMHPTAKMLVELSKSQDIEAGDGTTSVVIIAGALLGASQKLMAKGIHPTVISDSFAKAAKEAIKICRELSFPVDIKDRESLVQAAMTSLSSKVVSSNAPLLAPIAVDAVVKVAEESYVDLNDIRVVKKLGGTIDDTEIVDGIVFTQKASHTGGAPTRVTNAKIALIQFCLSAPKTDMENNVVISDYTQMDRVLKEERQYILNLCKAIKASGANVVLIQKSILRDAVSDIALNFLAKMKIMVVKDIERSEIEFITKTVGCSPAATPDSLTPERLGAAELVEEEETSSGRIVKVTGTPNSKTVSILVRGSNRMVLDETERSLHDALCVVRSIVKEKSLIVGGGAPEIQVALNLAKFAKTLSGLESYCFKEYAEAFEIIPYTLAENAGLHPISIVTELRNRHAEGETGAGINVRKSCISDLREENVLQPLLVNTSAISLATETVRMILKIDDILPTR